MKRNGAPFLWNGCAVLAEYAATYSADGLIVTNSLKQAILTVSKKVAGVMGDRGDKFTFTLELTKDNASYMQELSATKGNVALPPLTYDTETNTYPFELSHDETIIISVPYGYQYTITETNGLSQGYTVKINGTEDSDAAISGDITQNDVTVKFVNTRGLITPTGFTTNSYPYLLMLAIAAVGTTSFIYPACRRKRRRRDQ